MNLENQSREFKEIMNKERGFNKLFNFRNNSYIIKVLDGYVLHNSLCTQPVNILKTNVELMPSEKEYLGIDNIDYTVGKSVLGLHNTRVENEHCIFEETNLAKFMVTTDRLYNYNDEFISSDWATPIKYSLNKQESEFIDSDYFKNKDASILDYIKSVENTDIDDYKTIIILDKNGVVTINVFSNN